MKKILILVLPIILLLLCCALPVFADDPYVVSFTESPDGQTNTYKFELLCSDSEDGEFSWIETQNGSVMHNPLDSDAFYQYSLGLTSGQYVKAIRIYCTILGSGDALNVTFRNINLSAISPYEEDSGYVQLYYLDKSLSFYSEITSFANGVTAFSNDSKTFNWQATSYLAPYVYYSNNAGSYSFNAYFEFHLRTVNYLGWTSSTADGTPGGFGFNFYQEAPSSSVPVAYFISEYLDNFNDDFLSLSVLPVINVGDFVNGATITALLGNKLPALVNPFINIFIDEGTNINFRYLGSFCFGIFVLGILISYLRRAKK